MTIFTLPWEETITEKILLISRPVTGNLPFEIAVGQVDIE
jgi:hypothetical protein